MIQEKFDLFLDGWKAALKTFLAPLHQTFSFLSNPWISLGLIGAVMGGLIAYCVLRGRGNLRGQMKDTRVLAVCAMMIALNIILGCFSIQFSAYLRVGFGFITQPVVAMLFGPLVCCLTGMVQDVVSYVLNPTGAYVPAYTLCVGISGIFHGLILYRKPVTLGRVLLDKLLVVLVGNILLNSIALAPTVGSGFIGILPSRILKNLLLLPIQTIVSYLILKFAQQRKLLKSR